MGVGERWLSAVSVEQVVVEHELGHDSGHEPRKLSVSQAAKRRLGGGASAMASAASVLSPSEAIDTAPSIELVLWQLVLWQLVLCATAILSHAARPGRPAAPSSTASTSGSVARVAGQAALPAR